jgi:hypothetical protein
VTAHYAPKKKGAAAEAFARLINREVLQPGVLSLSRGQVFVVDAAWRIAVHTGEPNLACSGFLYITFSSQEERKCCG